MNYCHTMGKIQYVYSTLPESLYKLLKCDLGKYPICRVFFDSRSSAGWRVVHDVNQLPDWSDINTFIHGICVQGGMHTFTQMIILTFFLHKCNIWQQNLQNLIAEFWEICWRISMEKMQNFLHSAAELCSVCHVHFLPYNDEMWF